MGRTGTHSLKVAFELLLGGPCYHMLEAFEQIREHENPQAGYVGMSEGKQICYGEGAGRDRLESR
jgi:sulfotransferase family protein